MKKGSLVLLLQVILTVYLVASSWAAYVYPPDPLPRANAQAIWANGKVHWAGGTAATTAIDVSGKEFNSFHTSGYSIYNPSTNIWESTKWDDPTSPKGIELHVGANGMGDGSVNVDDGTYYGTSQAFAYDYDNDEIEEIFIHAGYPCFVAPGGGFFRFDPNGDAKWDRVGCQLGKDGTTVSQYRGIATRSGNKVYCVGGSMWGNGDGRAFSIFTFNAPGSNELGVWVDQPNAPFSVNGGVGAVVGTKLYVLGGSQSTDGGETTQLASIQSYDTGTRTWAAVPCTLLKGVNKPAVSVYDGKIYIIGGQDSTGSDCTDIQVFNPSNNTVSKLGDLPVGMSCEGGVISPDGILYAGGGRQAGTITNKWWKADLTVTPLNFDAITDDPAYFPYDDWDKGGAGLPWFTDATIPGTDRAEKPCDALPEVPGTKGQGVLLTRSMGIDTPLKQSHGMISFWINPNWNGDDGQTHKILRIGDPTQNGILVEKSAQGTFRFVMASPTKTTVSRVDVSSWRAHEWHHVAISWNDKDTSPLGLAMWIDRVAVESRVYGGDSFMNPSAMADKLVYIGDESSDAVMDELIVRKDIETGNQLAVVYQDYFRTAPYTAIQITNAPQRVKSDTRVVMQDLSDPDNPRYYGKQFGLTATKLINTETGETITEPITCFDGPPGSDWETFDAKPFIEWTSDDPNVVNVDANGLVTGNEVTSTPVTLSATFRGMAATYPVNVISWDQPDLDVTYVERTPKYGKGAYKIWPDAGEEVTSIVHYANFGYQPSSACKIRFELIPDRNQNFKLDENEVPYTTKNVTYNVPGLQPGEKGTLEVKWKWPAGNASDPPVFVRVTIDCNNTVSEICEANNQRCDLNTGRPLHWGYGRDDYGNSNTDGRFVSDYQNKTMNLVGSFSDYDWCQANVERLELLLRETVCPTTSPVGIQDSVRVDMFHTMDEYLDDHNNPDGLYQGGYEEMWDTRMTLSPGNIHEMGHTALGLPDMYGHEIDIPHIFLKDENGNLYSGTQLIPSIAGNAAPWSSATFGHPDALGVGYTPLMVNNHFWLEPNCAGLVQACNHLRKGVLDYVGDYVPNETNLQLFDMNDNPLRNARVYIYQCINTMEFKYYPDTPKFIFTDGGTGTYTIPTMTSEYWDDWATDNVEGQVWAQSPFDRSNGQRAYAPSWKVGEMLLLKIVGENGQTEFQTIPLSEFTAAYLGGNHDAWNFPILTSLTSSAVPPAVVPPVNPDQTENCAPQARIGCNGEVYSSDFYITIPCNNQDATIVTFDGSYSIDPEGQPLTYWWDGASGTSTEAVNTVSFSGPGDYEVRLYVMDGLRWSNTITAYVKIAPATSITGHVVDSNGNAAAKAVVGIKNSPYASADAQYYVTTDANGNYGPVYLSDGYYYVAAWMDGLAPSEDAPVYVNYGETVTQDLQLSHVAGKNLLLNSQSVAASNSDNGDAIYATDGDLSTAWQTCYWPDDPTYFYIDLGSPTDIDGLTIYRYFESQYYDDYSIDIMTDGSPLDGESWESNSTVQNVYSAYGTLHGYQVKPYLSADPIRLQLQGVRGIRIKFANNCWPDMYDIREIIVHSTTDFDGVAYGCVKNASGAPIYNAVVQLGGPESSLMTITDESGYWHFPLKPDTYQMYVDAPGYAGRIMNLAVPGDGTPLTRDIILDTKNEPGQYNGNFELTDANDSNKADGWEMFINDGGLYPNMYNIGRNWENTTPGGSGCGTISTGSKAAEDPWVSALLKPTNEHRVPVDPKKTYNFYFKAKKTGWTYGFWKLIWQNADGDQVGEVSSSWWIPEDTWTTIFQGESNWNAIPMVRMTPPADAKWAEIQFGFNEWDASDTGRYQTTYIDDIVFDEFSGVLPESNSINDVKNLDDEEIVRIFGKSLTVLGGRHTPAAEGVVPVGIPVGTGYIEESNRSSGLRLDLSAVSTSNIDPADVVNLSGVVSTTVDGEKYISVTSIDQTQNTEQIKTLLMNNRDLGGFASGQQAGLWDWRWVKNTSGTWEKRLLEDGGPNNVGILVKTYGKVTQIDPNGKYFYLDDGSKVDDGTTTNGVSNVGVRVALNGKSYTRGQFKTIIGVSSCFKHSDGKLRKMLRVISIK